MLTFSHLLFKVGKETPRNKEEKLSLAEAFDKALFIVCSFYKIDKGLILSKTRKREVVIARSMCIALLFCMGEWTFVKIGSMFHNRHHSTIIHILDGWHDQLDVNEQHRKEWQLIHSQLQFELGFPVSKLPLKVKKVVPQ